MSLYYLGYLMYFNTDLQRYDIKMERLTTSSRIHRLLEKLQSQCAITLIDVLQVLQQIQHNARAMNE